MAPWRRRALALAAMTTAVACATADPNARFDPTGDDGDRSDVDAGADDSPGDSPGDLPDAPPGDSPDEPSPPPSPDAGIVDAGVDAALPPPPPPPPPPDAGCSEAWVSLLDNGDFDAGHSGWTEAGGDLLSDAPPLTPQSGAWVARLLGFNNARTTLSQGVSVPTDAEALRLRGFSCFVTADPSATAVDLMQVELRSAGQRLETLAARSNLDAGTDCAWELFSWAASGAHAGLIVELALTGQSDGSAPTSFWFDTLTLEARVCR